MLSQQPAVVALVVLTDLVLASLVLVGVARAASRAGLSAAARRGVLATVVAVLGLWLGAALAVAQARLDVLHPLVLALIGGPVVVGYVALARSSTWRAVLRATPQSWLVGGQWYRSIGALFLVLWGAGELPAFFAIPAGVGDVVTGVGALVVAALVVQRVRGWERAVLSWNVVGFLDLVVAVGAGSTLLAGPLTAVFAAETSTAIIVWFPLGLIPLFLVPVSLTLHLYSLSNLKVGATSHVDAPQVASGRS